MDNKELYYLIEKYLADTATAEERERLLAWYRSHPVDEVVWESADPNEEERLEERLKGGIWAEMGKSSIAKNKKLRFWYYGAVAAFLLMAFGIAFWRALDGHSDKLIAQPPKEQAENRFVLLPDSSKVILRPGSRLRYKTDFSGATREVELFGEAYFDINRREDQPFIIHTGQVKTVVLGTAFTIKASEGQEDVQVTVQRGKVRVERAEAVLATLTANEQVHIKENTGTLPTKKVEAEQTMLWTVEDIRFDSQPFGKITEKLGRRYGAKIVFENAMLAGCPVTGGLTGMETLEEVLDLLCETRQASYTKNKDRVYTIRGHGCGD